jgi:hypothetical protein
VYIENKENAMVKVFEESNSIGTMNSEIRCFISEHADTHEVVSVQCSVAQEGYHSLYMAIVGLREKPKEAA